MNPPDFPDYFRPHPNVCTPYLKKTSPQLLPTVKHILELHTDTYGTEYVTCNMCGLLRENGTTIKECDLLSQTARIPRIPITTIDEHKFHLCNEDLCKDENNFRDFNEE
jgi:hypothetical protein